MSAAVRKVLNLYTMKREAIPTASEEDKQRRIEAFETTCPTGITEECRRLLALAGWGRA